jgi:rSAM/selenodomain-associated transferase 1
MASGRLIIFAKAPILGSVKSRIAASIGPVKALEIYQTILCKLFTNLRSLNNVQVRVTPDASAAEFSVLCSLSWTFRPQGEGDLGARLYRAFAESFEQETEPVVIVGSDCPEVTTGDIHDAFAALNAHDLVLGPALDGGYWLIGLRQPCAALFDQIDWSTPRVLNQTLQCARDQNLRVHMLRELSDVDTIEDWNRHIASSR